MAVLKHRFSVFLFLIVVAFATVVHAHPDGSQSYSSSDWEWTLYSVGNQFVDTLANNQFGRLVSSPHNTVSATGTHRTIKTTPPLPDNVVDPQLHAHPQLPSNHQQYYRPVNSDGNSFPTPPLHQTYNAAPNAQHHAGDFYQGPSIMPFSQESAIVHQAQNQALGDISHWRPAQHFEQVAAVMPVSSAARTPAMTQSHLSMDAAYRTNQIASANVRAMGQQFLPSEVSLGIPSSSASNAAQLAYHQPRSYPYQSGQLPDSILLDNVTSDPAQDLTAEITSNYNYQAGKNESVSGMVGWLQRASTFGDRVMPRIDTAFLQPPTTTTTTGRNPAPPSPSSASTTASSSRLSTSKRNRAQMTAGHHAFVCHLCNAGFRAQGDLTHHLRCHQPYENRAHQCQQCGRRFQYRKDLNRHLPKHDPNAPRYYCRHYGCKYATKGFGRQDHLDRHVSTQHRADTPQQTASPIPF